MKIRAITLFVPLTWPFDFIAIHSASRFLRFAKAQMEATGYEVQTLRLATPPFMDLVGDPDPEKLITFAAALEKQATDQGIDAVSIGPVMAATPRGLLSPIRILADIIANTKKIFASVLVGSSQTGINLAAIKATADTIKQLSQNTPQGLGNLRFAMLANVPAGSPFFPGAYHDSSNPAFGIATEAADVAVRAIRAAQTLAQAQDALVNALNVHSMKIRTVVEFLVDEHSVSFNGIDFSLAPFPHVDRSIGAAMEHLGVEAFGGHGTLFATAFLTHAIKEASFQSAGFSGVMLPILEDTILAQRAAEQAFTVNDLLLYSAVCGTGLDTVPIPGDATTEQISALLLDTATLSVSLNKPLTARLLPMPGLEAGDPVIVDDPYLTNSVVMPLKSNSAATLFSKSSFFNL